MHLSEGTERERERERINSLLSEPLEFHFQTDANSRNSLGALETRRDAELRSKEILKGLKCPDKAEKVLKTSNNVHKMSNKTENAPKSSNKLQKALKSSKSSKSSKRSKKAKKPIGRK